MNTYTHTQTMNFVVNIPAEVRRIKEMKYKCYISPKAYVVQNTKHKTILKSESSDDSVSTDNLTAILEQTIRCIHKIINIHTEDDLKHVGIEILSEDVYLSNVLNEWLNKWKINNFENRPNAQLLNELYDLSRLILIEKSTRLSPEECPPLQLVR